MEVSERITFYSLLLFYIKISSANFCSPLHFRNFSMLSFSAFVFKNPVFSCTEIYQGKRKFEMNLDITFANSCKLIERRAPQIIRARNRLEYEIRNRASRLSNVPLLNTACSYIAQTRILKRHRMLCNRRYRSEIKFVNSKRDFCLRCDK